MKKKVSMFVCTTACAVMVSAGAAWAGPGNPSGTGQPNQSCETTGTRPGNAASSPGSAFAEGGVAGGVYAGEQTQNSKNPHSVSQYDVACTKNASG